jgi:hypothetical protein
MRVRALVLSLAPMVVPLATATLAGDVHASVSIAVTWDGLLRESTAAAVVTPIESTSVWENGRIYSYARVHVDRGVAGELATGSEAWVRTMGGVVGRIGQLVDGEAVLALAQPSLLFLHSGPIGALEVTARGQGQFPVVVAADGHAPGRIVRSNAVGALVAPHVLTSSAATRLAAEVLRDRPVDEVALDVAANWGRTHAR